MENCIASRTYVLDGDKDVKVSIGRPTKSNAFDEFNCAYEIVGLSKPSRDQVTAIDAVQAIILALARIGTELTESAEAQEGRLSWLGEGLERNRGLFTFDDLRKLAF